MPTPKFGAEVRENQVTPAQSRLPFTYRGFYDVPRMLVVERKGYLYLFDCPFDEELDDFPDHYTVYRLDPSVWDRLDAGSWVDLAQAGQRIGRVSVRDVEFDESRRRYIHERAFSQILPGN